MHKDKYLCQDLNVSHNVYMHMHADTIYVRTFEDRMDLHRAAMAGAAGTPYHDGLFFFDMQLPPSYPAVPPLVYYHSFGLDLVEPQPGRHGRRVPEPARRRQGARALVADSPASSSVLQVVVSLQAGPRAHRAALLQRVRVRVPARHAAGTTSFAEIRHFCREQKRGLLAKKTFTESGSRQTPAVGK